MKKLIFLSILLLTSCVDFSPDPVDPNKPLELPPITMEGKNIIGCKVNGVVWVSYVPINTSGDEAFKMGYDSTDGHFGINSWWIRYDRTKDENLRFESYLSDTIVGLYKIKFVRLAPNYIIWRPKIIVSYIDTNSNNYIHINYHDKNKRIISGTFEFVAIDTTVNKDTIRFTEGRFDGKY